jgi:hypothetical protein
MCEGCQHFNVEARPCEIYEFPERQHTRIGGCAMDSRKVREVKEFKLNPLKASKRGEKVK